MRGMNARWQALPDESSAPDPIDRAIANEAAVRLYRRVVEQGAIVGDLAIASAVDETARWLKLDSYVMPEPLKVEVEQMARSLEWRYARDDLIFGPGFPGCGLLSACEGDFLKGSTLVEIKSGHRGFRSPDLRQVITYLALNYATDAYTIKRVNLYNARLNRLVDLSVDDLCLQLGGDGPGEVFSRVVEFLAGGIASGV